MTDPAQSDPPPPNEPDESEQPKPSESEESADCAGSSEEETADESDDGDDFDDDESDDETKPKRRAARSSAPQPRPKLPTQKPGFRVSISMVLVVVLAAAVVVLVLRERGESDQPVAAKQTYAPVVRALEKAGRTHEAERVRGACAQAPRCKCVQTAARAALDRDLHAEAQALLKATQSDCQAETEGMNSEALARARRSEEARKAATAVLQKEPDNAYAVYALAHAHYVEGNQRQAWAQAELAAQRGRGAPAHLLLGLMSFRQGNLDAAKGHFEKMLQDDSNNIDALYNLALVAHRRNRYRAAREGYLKVLRLAPRNLDSRYNLALLVHAAGATMEAQHHLKKLKQVAPAGDRRVAKLERALGSGGPPKSRSKTLQPLDGGIYRTPGSAKSAKPGAR